VRPRATYRLQLTASFGFAAARTAIPYFVELGISHLYLSPVLQAAAGSTHGYDVIDPERVSRELGGEDELRALVAAAREAELAILLDIVPNHMSIDTGRTGVPGNRWWLDVLENGAASFYAHVFDVDWSTGDDRVLLPVLGERYGRALASRQISIIRAGGTFEVRAGELRLPLAPRSIGAIVRRAGERIRHPELAFLGDALSALPVERGPEARRRRHRDKAVLLRRLAELGPAADRVIDDELAATNADPAELDITLEAQSYRLAHWTVAGSQLGYRRFFDITSLVGLRNEDPEVFAASHARILAWLADGSIDGVRIDHVDGLREPVAYLGRLREAAPEAWIVVEKILAHGEILPATWPCDGTTGYDFMEHMGTLFVDPDGERALTDAFQRYTGKPFEPIGERRVARLEVMTDALHGELSRLTELALRATTASVACRDYTRTEIEHALAELFAGYPAYRTYGGEHPDPAGRERLTAAVAAAKRARPDLDADLLAFLEAALAFELPANEARDLAFAAQQTSGAIIAKGDEDTLSYRQVRLISRCEVGADLDVFAQAPTVVHAALAAGRPRSLLATSTHDSKRGEDVRMRIAVLSETPARTEETFARFAARAEAGWGDVARDHSFEYAAWQTFVGAWPLTVERAQIWAEKATREARQRTSWRKPDVAYEAARRRWIERVFEDRELCEELAAFAAELAPHGDRNSLAQTLVKLTAPGVPDFYQGSELRDDNLVDPDNRRQVDLVQRAQLLHELGESAPPADDLARAKLWLIRRVLSARRRDPALFEGSYAPLAATGPHAHRVFAFTRGHTMLTVVPRLGVPGWRDTQLALADGRWRNVLGEGAHAGSIVLDELWQHFPVALLLREP
jgi:(1->4)-alpha-D-glucan 1-alpha-D-glucosylmutase